MAVTTGPNLKLLINATAGEEHYAALCAFYRGIDGLAQPRVLDKDLTTPPTIVDGALYIIPAGATGAWASKTGQLARGFTVGTGSPAWEFYVPLAGWSVSVVDELDIGGAPQRYVYNGTAWVVPTPSTGLATDTTTAFTLGLTHAGKYVQCNNAGSTVVTVPPQSSVAWPVGTEITLEQSGAGSVTLAPGAGVTINKIVSNTLAIAGQYGVVTLKRTASDVWTLFGALGSV